MKRKEKEEEEEVYFGMSVPNTIHCVYFLFRNRDTKRDLFGLGNSRRRRPTEGHALIQQPGWVINRIERVSIWCQGLKVEFSSLQECVIMWVIRVGPRSLLRIKQKRRIEFVEIPGSHCSGNTYNIIHKALVLSCTLCPPPAVGRDLRRTVEGVFVPLQIKTHAKQLGVSVVGLEWKWFCFMRSHSSAVNLKSIRCVSLTTN